MRRPKLAELICQLAGGQNVARIIDARNAWPAVAELQLSTGPKLFSMHVSICGPMSRGKEWEYRFQNPADRTPVQTIDNHPPLLIGLWQVDDPPILVAAQADLRLGDRTRQSYLFNRQQVEMAQLMGWVGPYTNTTHQKYYFFYPALLPTFAELSLADVDISQSSLQHAIDGAGLSRDHGDPEAAVRVRRSSTRLVRSAKFSSEVVAAYNKRCAMCGLNLGLVSGAHILPVAATDNVQFDAVWNGLCLCDNHHRAFDNHYVHVDPETYSISLDDRLKQLADKEDFSRAFVISTFPRLRLPKSNESHPRKDMFVERYAHFDGRYDWIKP